jgi:hypothetical protein
MILIMVDTMAEAPLVPAASIVMHLRRRHHPTLMTIDTTVTRLIIRSQSLRTLLPIPTTVTLLVVVATTILTRLIPTTIIVPTMMRTASNMENIPML